MAAENLVQYLRDQLVAAGALPDADTIVVERVRDELGDWRICVLSPRGGRVHAPWAMAAAARIREETGVDVETLWGDDGFVVRFPDVDRPPDPWLLVPDAHAAHALVLRQLGATALFAGKFRENAARSLLLPKRRPGMRAPLWQQRKRAADLLAVASRYGSFPVLLETYRECLRDFFDMPALTSTLADLHRRTIRLAVVDSDKPSPFAASLLFSYVASFLYDGDAPLAERRAQALAVDQHQLRELIGDAELRELVDADAMEAVEAQLQRLDPKYHARSADAVHDMLLAIGDLSHNELRMRAATSGELDRWIDWLVAARRVIAVPVAGEARYIAVEDAARLRDALGTPLPPGLPEALLAPAEHALANLVARYARTHAPFTAPEAASRFGLRVSAVEAALRRLTIDGRLLEGEFRPGGTSQEWTEPGVLAQVRRRSLAKLRREVEPVDQRVLGRLTTTWQGIVNRRRGIDAVLDAIEQLQGVPLVASTLDSEILPARIDGYDPSDLDQLAAAGELAWIGLEPLGERDGRIALYLADHVQRLLPPRVTPVADMPGGHPDREAAILECLQSRGASYFGPLHDAVGGGYPGETLDTIWDLVWKGLVTNDTFQALRVHTRSQVVSRRRRRQHTPVFRSRRLAPESGEGRWSATQSPVDGRPPTSLGTALNLRKGRQSTGSTRLTSWAAAMAQQLLARHGLVTREVVTVENIPGGFSTVYPVLKALEESGRVRRGYFVAGLGAAQFALPGAVDLLRSQRDLPDEVELVVLSATDPANPYGGILKWPAASAARGPTRTVGATVILVNGALAAYLARGDHQLLVFLPEAEPDRSKAGRAVARALIARAREHTGSDETPRGMLIEEIDGAPSTIHPMAPHLVEAGFAAGAMGFRATFPTR